MDGERTGLSQLWRSLDTASSSMPDARPLVAAFLNYHLAGG